MAVGTAFLIGWRRRHRSLVLVAREPIAAGLTERSVQSMRRWGSHRLGSRSTRAGDAIGVPRRDAFWKIRGLAGSEDGIRRKIRRGDR